MNPTTLGVLGLAILVATGVSVLRTAGGLPSGLVRVTVRSLIGARRVGLRLSAENASGRRGERVGWVALLVVPMVWGAGVVAGTMLLALSMGIGSGEHPVPVFGLTGGGVSSLVLVVATWAGLITVLAVSLAMAAVVLRARLRRDRFVQGLLVEARSCLEAEDVLATWLSATPDAVDRMLETCRCWVDDLDLSRRSRLELAALPSSSSPLFWLDALMIVLDVAALSDALRPAADRGARGLLIAGSAYVQELASRLGLTVVTVVPSLHGREERSFGVTVARLVYSGVQLDRDLRTAEHVFYEWRRGYAPYIVALADRLRPGDPAVGAGARSREGLIIR